MKRAIIIGCPGGGKSTFARALAQATGLPLHYLDMMYWNEDRTTIPKEEFLQKLDEVIRQDEWIIDGNYNSSIEMRLKACDTVFFLDYPVEVCLEGVEARRGNPRDDMPWVENGVDADFIDFIRKYPLESRPEVVSLLEKYPDRELYVFHSRQEAADYLNSLK